ncbi:hypothetical protein EX30DRAFT_248587 [Ascodesmis nigricans]|uniref:Uncharacterized protein n=1 Tax=Ascodesmis nigricans TaxID=341454 RepID=A0A4S2MML8_9PEZI|nr:hypothetical protein EX30DRAFT_248587 [Ascodesmis nigricans]
MYYIVCRILLGGDVRKGNTIIWMILRDLRHVHVVVCICRAHAGPASGIEMAYISIEAIVAHLTYPFRSSPTHPASHSSLFLQSPPHIHQPPSPHSPPLYQASHNPLTIPDPLPSFSPPHPPCPIQLNHLTRLNPNINTTLPHTTTRPSCPICQQPSTDLVCRGRTKTCRKNISVFTHLFTPTE